MKHLLLKQNDKAIRSIAYFSMEIGIRSDIPTYSGGLGVLAGDTLKSFSDLIVPVVGVTLLSRKGYFKQKIVDGRQQEVPEEWNPQDHMELMKDKVVISLEGRDVVVAAWKYEIEGIKGFKVPVFFLDTNLVENHQDDRAITDYLYGGDSRYRIKQEAILGIAGTRMLENLGYKNIEKYHMNEGHSAFLTLELLRQTFKNEETDSFKMYDVQAVQEKCVFTTHTPVAAGHDQFLKEDYEDILGRDFINPEFLADFFYDGKLNMTLLALSNSNHINGVALKHTEVSKAMFPGYTIDSITNGIHSGSWTCDEFKELYTKHISGWIHDPFNLRYALGISRKEIWEAHLKAKQKLVDNINSRYNTNLKMDILTIGFARRTTQYKRLDLFFKDIDKLLKINDTVGKIQVIISGKAHPKDTGGKDLIKRFHDIINELKGKIEIVYIENYNIEIAKLLISGVDLWLNTPKKPLEASGTSGMKAAHNGIPQLSVLDGWWLEGHIENVTGWSIGGKAESSDDEDAQDLYIKLREIIVPMFYNDWDKWTEIMRHVIAFNASFFNTNRMVHQYVLNSYFH